MNFTNLETEPCSADERRARDHQQPAASDKDHSRTHIDYRPKHCKHTSAEKEARLGKKRETNKTKNGRKTTSEKEKNRKEGNKTAKPSSAGINTHLVKLIADSQSATFSSNCRFSQPKPSPLPRTTPDDDASWRWRAFMDRNNVHEQQEMKRACASDGTIITAMPRSESSKVTGGCRSVPSAVLKSRENAAEIPPDRSDVAFLLLPSAGVQSRRTS
jgi:hypothetical protein